LKLKELPLLLMLFTVISPPSLVIIALQMVKPIPVPPVKWDVCFLIWVNFTKIFSKFSYSIKIPVSIIEKL
jgi:hypothetical protein